MKTSMLTDLEAGKPLELEWLNGAVVRLGAALGLETPINREVVDALKPFAEGGDKRSLTLSALWCGKFTSGQDKFRIRPQISGRSCGMIFVM